MSKVIIAGSRHITDLEVVERAVSLSGFQITEIVSGGARGVDTLAKRFAHEQKLLFREFPADWGSHGRAAGPKRNEEMARYADSLIAIPREDSAGTKDMIWKMIWKGKQVFISFYPGKETGRFL